jgi:hypothetical protein
MRLEDYARAQVGGSIESHAGIWLVPLRIDFAGVLYTEELRDPASFNSMEAMNLVADDVKTPVKIGRPRLGADGLLQFDYVGPRYAFLLILSREARTGRAFVQELARRAKDSALHMGSNKPDQNMIVEAPLELFPGYIADAVDVQTAALPDQYRKVKNFALLRANGTSVRRVSCDSGVTGELAFTTRESEAGSSCLGLVSMPVLEFDLPVRVGASDKLNLSLFQGLPKTKLSCDSLPDCASPAAIIRFPLRVNGLQSVRAVDQDGSVPREALRRYDTKSLALAPHRIHSLGELVRNFYNRLGESRPVTDWTTVSLCRAPG